MRVRWTESAARDLTSICDYTEEQSGPEAARKVAIRVFQRVGSLLQFPHAGRVGRRIGTRELILSGLPFLRYLSCPGRYHRGCAYFARSTAVVLTADPRFFPHSHPPKLLP